MTPMQAPSGHSSLAEGSNPSPSTARTPSGGGVAALWSVDSVWSFSADPFSADPSSTSSGAADVEGGPLGRGSALLALAVRPDDADAGAVGAQLS